MFCNKCGNIVPDNAKFCSSCGAVLNGGSNVNVPCDHPHPGQGLPPVSFVTAIQNFFLGYCNFSGRARRSEYWFAMLFLGLLSSVLSWIFQDWLLQVVNLLLFLPNLAVTIRRLHDAGKSGVYYLWNLLPIVGQIMVLVQLLKDSQYHNQWGPSPKYM